MRDAMSTTPRSARHGDHAPSRPPVSRASRQIGTLFAVEVLLLWVLGLALVGSSNTGLLSPLDQRVADAVGLAATGGAHTVAAAITWLGSAVMLIPLVALIAVVARRRHSWTPVVTAALAIGGAEAVSQVVKRLIERPRPSGASAHGFAFPSGHATFAAATFLTLALMVNARRRRHLAVALAVACTAAVSWSRLALGVHWLSDVTAGALVGWSWAIAAAVVVAAPSQTRVTWQRSASARKAESARRGPSSGR
jgi:undecaprenyl-diphosphatase